MYSSLLLDSLFIVATTIIWFMIAYQLVLFVAGYKYSLRSAWKGTTLPPNEPLPGVSILIPARNEAKVIASTLKALCALDYPSDAMEIIVIDDGSTDGTGEIVKKIAKHEPRIRCLTVPEARSGQGKAAALEYASAEASYDLIAIYDADNRPEPRSLRILVAALVNDPSLAAAVGKFRTINRNRNLLTRFINLESLAFQWIVQAGRWSMLRVTTLPGTNFVIWRHVIDQVGGWDHEALTEDSELSIRIYETGLRIRFVPQAVTWEQEPERLRVWFRQRVRWARGQNYVLAKHAPRLLKLRPRVLALELGYTLLLYYAVCGAIALSDILFVLACLGLISIHAIGPFSSIWILAFLLFVLEVGIALSREPGEDSFGNLMLVVAAYFTYCQLWILVVIRAIFEDVVLHRKRTWAKTERFAEVRLP
jgi:cellulose synthase/poly-beta-1,6-N-acetylglucosamine synthase-like glycosyltransferase